MTDPRAALHGEGAPDEAEDRHGQRVAQLRSRLLTSTADLARIPRPQPLVDGWLYADSMAWLFGRKGHGKSFVTLDMAACISAGLPWHGHPVKQCPVLYVVMEGAAGLHQRVAAWEDYHAAQAAITYLIPRTLDVITDARPLTDLALEMQAGLIVIDTQNRATAGLDENSSVDMGRMIAAADLLRQDTRACVCFVHHTSGEGKRPRGHTSIDGAAASLIRVHKDGAMIAVRNEAQKDVEAGQNLFLTARPHLGSVVLAVGEGAEKIAPTDSEQIVWAALHNLEKLRGDATFTEIKQACTSQGMAYSTFTWALKRLSERGRVIKSNRKYQVVHAGQDMLDGAESSEV